MRRLAWILTLCLVSTAVAEPKLSRNEARKRIAAFASADLPLGAIEIRKIDQQTAETAVADTTVTLAFQFRRDDAGSEWIVDAVRLADRDWVNMQELLGAIYHGNIPPQTGSAPATREPSPIERVHVNPTEFEQVRKRMTEIGLSSHVPREILLQRISAQNDKRTIAETSVTLGFRFQRNSKTGDWAIDAARLGDRSWVDTNDLVATLNEGRRRDTIATMKTLVAGIERFILEDGSLPPGKDIVELTNVLHPHYMKDLVRLDGWGRPLEYKPSGLTFRLVSRGPDGRLGTQDDILVP